MLYRIVAAYGRLQVVWACLVLGVIKSGQNYTLPGRNDNSIIALLCGQLAETAPSRIGHSQAVAPALCPRLILLVL